MWGYVFIVQNNKINRASLVLEQGELHPEGTCPGAVPCLHGQRWQLCPSSSAACPPRVPPSPRFPDQPDNPSEENCGVIRTESFGGWQNRDCGIALPYVCKKKPNATADPFLTGEQEGEEPREGAAPYPGRVPSRPGTVRGGCPSAGAARGGAHGVPSLPVAWVCGAGVELPRAA